MFPEPLLPSLTQAAFVCTALTPVSPGWVLAAPESEPEGTRRTGGAQTLPHPWRRFLPAGSQSLILCPLFLHSSFHPPSLHSSPSSLHDSAILFPLLAEEHLKFSLWLTFPVGSGCCSPLQTHLFPLSSSCIFHIWLFLECGNHTPAPEPLHLLLPLRRLLFPTSPGSCTAPRSRLKSNITTSERPGPFRPEEPPFLPVTLFYFLSSSQRPFELSCWFIFCLFASVSPAWKEQGREHLASLPPRSSTGPGAWEVLRNVVGAPTGRHALCRVLQWRDDGMQLTGQVGRSRLRKGSLGAWGSRGWGARGSGVLRATGRVREVLGVLCLSRSS